MNWDFGPLQSVIATPVFHSWHRSREPEAWDKNFAGLLPIWDILFGTSNVPKDRWSENFGINEPMLGGVLVQMWEPFSRLMRWEKMENPSTRPRSRDRLAAGKAHDD